MRGFGFFGSAKRNDNYVAADPRPLPRYANSVHSGNVGLDGYERLAIADPERAGARPSVAGTIGPTHRGPDSSFEQ